MTTPFVPKIEAIDNSYDESEIFLGYGGAGVGKTEFAGSIGEDGIILMIGAGQKTLKSPGFRKRHAKLPRMIIINESYNPATGIFNTASAFDEVCDTMDYLLENKVAKTIAIDEATFLSKFARNKAVEYNNEQATGATTSLTKARKHGFVIADISDYGKEMSILDWFFSIYVPRFKEYKVNLLVLAHERITFKAPEKIGADPVIAKISPGFTGKTFPDTITNYFDTVWRFTCTQGKLFRQYTMPTNIFTAKTRWSGAFKEIEEGMTWPLYIKRIKESI